MADRRARPTAGGVATASSPGSPGSGAPTAMTAPARLLALRLQGFKSFAERTIVEFGPGISAVVGPNGSGKSNLADALRWSLGEQGRALRSRKSEDVIFAGSEKRSALGMADVTLVLDNGDGLLPVDYSVLELGRRLYRSGENDYLLNKQRIRLRDLVDLLDAAHLADNAFLFIGQGMVDQALALRPEERRPLFEEVAGVRRHERRRRKAEEQLAESEANLARVEDILAELRPQARRLAIQAEQQTTRLTAGDELANALLLVAHARWNEAAAAAAVAAARVERERHEADRAMAELQAAEEAAAAIASDLGERAAAERERLAEHESRAVGRDGAAPARCAPCRRPGGDPAGPAAGRRGARGLRRVPGGPAARAGPAAAAARPRPGRGGRGGGSPARGGERRARVPAGGEPGTGRGGGRDPSSRGGAAGGGRDRAVAGSPRRIAGWMPSARLRTRSRRDGWSSTRRLAAARASVAEATTAAESASRALADARAAAADADARRRTADEREAGVAAALAAQQARLAAIESRLREDEERGIARAARRHGGRRLDDELQVDPALRAAVEATLDELARAYVVDATTASALAGERGMLVIRERAARPAATAGRGDPAVPRSPGHGRRLAARRRDPTRSGRFGRARAGAGGRRRRSAGRAGAPGGSSGGLDGRDPGRHGDRHRPCGPPRAR